MIITESMKRVQGHFNGRCVKVMLYSSKCGQCFTQISSLQKHGRVHDKRKPYICKYDSCGMAFTQASNLIRHERIHTGIKPYKCDRCDKSFASSSNLKQHKEIHQSEVGSI
uniref:Putative zinc finger transcription factor protein n=1 Tax=Euplotes crassus TaxID=5936 RepID=Q3I4W8_EUPCR|nr:putative zinc finger transcription factor protein [Moneuplotes crassus]